MERSNLQQQEQETKRILFWSAGLLATFSALGLFLWSQAGTAVFFDKIAASFAGCFGF